ncbi:MAG: hypothetical protein IID41_08180 [Planctomycetes bacterium]|nr:hypothetical protein [Planctomycetota bacterium]
MIDYDDLRRAQEQRQVEYDLQEAREERQWADNNIPAEAVRYLGSHIPPTRSYVVSPFGCAVSEWVTPRVATLLEHKKLEPNYWIIRKSGADELGRALAEAELIKDDDERRLAKGATWLHAVVLPIVARDGAHDYPWLARLESLPCPFEGGTFFSWSLAHFHHRCTEALPTEYCARHIRSHRFGRCEDLVTHDAETLYQVALGLVSYVFTHTKLVVFAVGVECASQCCTNPARFNEAKCDEHSEGER